MHAILVSDGCSTAMHAALVADGCSAAMHAIFCGHDCSAAMHAWLVVDKCAAAKIVVSVFGHISKTAMGENYSGTPTEHYIT